MSSPQPLLLKFDIFALERLKSNSDRGIHEPAQITRTLDPLVRGFGRTSITTSEPFMFVRRSVAPGILDGIAHFTGILRHDALTS